VSLSLSVSLSVSLSLSLSLSLSHTHTHTQNERPFMESPRPEGLLVTSSSYRPMVVPQLHIKRKICGAHTRSLQTSKHKRAMWDW
jgi:hypothetical protein